MAPGAPRVALVTGAASGMGQLASWRLAAGDAAVAALDVDADGLARTARRAPNITPITCDVTDADAVERAVAEVVDRLGPIDRVMNAAAIAPTGRLLDQPVEQITRVMEVNYFGLVNVTKATMPAMVERGHGELVQFASLAGWLPSQTFGAYSATKFAVVCFTETLAHEMAGSGVRVCAVCPPVVDTPLLEQIGPNGPKRFDEMPRITPEEVLDAIEVALERGQLFAFPGRGTRTLVRLRRFIPSVVWRQIDAMEAGSARPTLLPPRSR